LDVTFNWKCGLTKKDVMSNQPALEIVSSLYNFAVTQMTQASLYVRQGSADETRHAFQLLQQAAWVFNHLLLKTQEISQIEQTVDLSKEALTMWMNISLA
jgi:hypothetical protein